jgi:hypothetical protein
MHRDELKHALAEVRQRLETAEDVDPELKTLLEGLDADIHALLEREEHDSEQAGFVLEQAQALDAQFAAKHPQLEAVFREVVNALARMGI